MNCPANKAQMYSQERNEHATQPNATAAEQTLQPQSNEPCAPKKKRGRPRSFAKGSLANICVSIEAEQKQWLDEVAASAPHESASKVVREALDLWYAVHKEGLVLTNPSNTQAYSTTDEDDDFDYSWH